MWTPVPGRKLLSSLAPDARPLLARAAHRSALRAAGEGVWWRHEGSPGGFAVPGGEGGVWLGSSPASPDSQPCQAPPPRFVGRLDVFFGDVAIQTLCSHLINLPFHYRTARIPHVILTCSRYKSSSGMLFANTFSRSLRCLPIFSRASSEAQKLLIPISPTCSLFLCGLCFWRHIEEAVP